MDLKAKGLLQEFEEESNPFARSLRHRKMMFSEEFIDGMKFH
jgi:hypothetical protein